MKEKIKKKKKELILITVILIILIFFFSGFSMGKGYAKSNINGVAEIAKPILKVENGESININNNNEKGIYEFTIKNYDEQDNLTQVDLDYYIEILNDLHEAIEINLTKDGEKVEIKNNKTETFSLTKDKKEENNYKLEIIYNKEKNNNMEDILSQLQIKVHSEQKQEVL